MHSTRVGFVVHVMQVAGAEVLVAETIRRLGGRIEPVVLCLDAVGPLGERLQSEGVPVVSLGRRPGLDWAVAGRMAAEIRGRRIEVLHAHQYTPFFYAVLGRIRSRRRVHVMFTEHGRHYPDVVSAKRRLVNRCLLSRLAGEVNAVCRFSAQALADKEGFGHRQIEVIENGIDADRYQDRPDRSQLRAELGLDPSRAYIICVARFHPVKDHRTLLAAFARVAQARPDTDLLLAGDGPERPALEAQAASLGIASRVRFLGVRRDAPALLQASDIFTLTSVSEAASLTLLEAMASALPVVVTDVGGNPEIVRRDVDGLFAPRGDAAALSQAYLALLADPVRRQAMGQAGRERVRTHYLLDDTIRKYGDRYEAGAARLRRLPPVLAV